MDKVKEMLAAGVSLPSAIKELLPMSVTAFADKYGMARSITSEVINLDRRPREAQCDALAKELGGTPQQWADLLWKAAKPAAMAS